MNFLLEIPTWILGGIAILLVIVILIMITKFLDNRDKKNIPQPQKKVAPPIQHHKLYPGYIHDPTLPPDVEDLLKKRIQKKNDGKQEKPDNLSKKNDDDNNNEESKPSARPKLTIIQGGKSGK